MNRHSERGPLSPREPELQTARFLLWMRDFEFVGASWQSSLRRLAVALIRQRRDSSIFSDEHKPLTRRVNRLLGERSIPHGDNTPPSNRARF